MKIKRKKNTGPGPRFSRNELQLLYWGLQAVQSPPKMGFLMARLKKRLIKLGAIDNPAPSPKRESIFNDMDGYP